MLPALATLLLLNAPLLAPRAEAPTVAVVAPLPDAPLPDAALPDAIVTDGWQARAEDNLCGLRDPRQVSNPAKIDFRRVMEATPEMRKLRRERIDPGSPEGIQLTEAARTRVAEAAEAAMSELGHCSVWKAIRHTDGRQVAEVSDAVLQRL